MTFEPMNPEKPPMSFSPPPKRLPLRRRMSIIIRSVIFNILFYLNLIFLLIICLPKLFMGRHAALDVARRWGRNSLWLLEKICGTRLEFRGLENIPPGAVIVAAKHQSILETFALVLKFPDFSYVLKHELTWIPLFGWYLKAAEQVAINRATGAAALAQVAERARPFLREGRALFIFPEGTRRPVCATPRYKYGITHLYLALDTPVLPVALDTGLFWPRRSFLRKPGVCVIAFLPVILPGLDVDVFPKMLESIIETQTEALIAEAVRKDPYLAPPPRAGQKAV